MLRFEWDDNKNSSNEIKHHINFNEAISVFYDDDALLIYDPDHSKQEERFIILGLNSKGDLLIVCHCYRSNEEIIRLISARKATKNEEKMYGERKYEKRIRLH